MLVLRLTSAWWPGQGAAKEAETLADVLPQTDFQGILAYREGESWVELRLESRDEASPDGLFYSRMLSL